MLSFSKFSGSGNDFIIIDDREGAFGRLSAAAPEKLVRRICQRRFSVGADGLILIVADAEVDFAWRFFNADGSEVEMCGNGGRCAARFAYLQGIAGRHMAFRTLAGIMRAEILKKDRVKLEVGRPKDLEPEFDLNIDGLVLKAGSINTGVPHVVVEVFSDLDACEVVRLGRAIRHHPRFAPAGTNANFISQAGPEALAIRTYERGVEDETLACGTGSIASALICAQKGRVSSPVRVKTRGGEILSIHFALDAGGFKDVFLEGGAAHVYDGVLQPEAWERPA
ncbi:MAG: diaminopimelate epimerase [Pseudomonadota bacterium]